MFKNISFGVYYPGNSILHRLQARTKLLLLIWCTIFLTIANNHVWHFAPYIVLAAMIVLGTVLAGISFGQMWGRMRLLVLLSLLAAIPTIFSATDSSKALYTIAPVNISFGQLRWAIALYGILLMAYVIFLLLPLPAVRSFLQHHRLQRMSVLLIFLTLAATLLHWFSAV